MDRPEHAHDEVEETNQQQEHQHHAHGHTHHHSHHGHGHNHTHAAPPTALPPPINNNQDQQAILKAQIRQIQSSTSLTPKEKAESVQNLMMKQWNDSRDKVVLTKRQGSDTEADRKYEVANCKRNAAESGIHVDFAMPVSNECINGKCKTVFGRYFCVTCKFFDDDPTKDIYHCDKCRICRIGKVGPNVDNAER
ncbi:hypothetical protein FI667_g6559, partial [Globisporangium splendens]